MPKHLAQSLKLFLLDPTSSVLTEMFSIDRAESFSHSTRLPGGFFHAKLILPTTEREYWQWRQERQLFRLLMQEDSTKVIWEGRLEEIKLLDVWSVQLGFVGYWSNFRDGRYNANVNTTGGSIVQTVRDALHADVDKLSTSNTFIETGPTVDQDYQDDWDSWRVLTDTLRGVTAFGAGSDNLFDLAVWDNRDVYYTERTPTAITWRAFALDEHGGGVRHLGVRTDWQNVANAVDVTYLSTGTVTRTGYLTDTVSIAATQRREKRIPSIGESTSGPAEQRRATELAARKDFQQETPGIQIDRLWDPDGIEWPLCRVRAGDVIRIPDFVPRTGDLDAVTLDGFSTFFIEETDCNHATGVLTLRPDRDGTDLGAILRRNNIK